MLQTMIVTHRPTDAMNVSSKHSFDESIKLTDYGSLISTT